jgi:hypothetical protein
MKIKSNLLIFSPILYTLKAQFSVLWVRVFSFFLALTRPSGSGSAFGIQIRIRNQAKSNAGPMQSTVVVAIHGLDIGIFTVYSGLQLFVVGHG